MWQGQFRKKNLIQKTVVVLSGMDDEKRRLSVGAQAYQR
jgi:hypothetical protein